MIVEYIKEYQVWIGLVLLVIVAVPLFLAIFNRIMESGLPGKDQEKAIKLIRKILLLSERQIFNLKKANGREVVDTLLKEAGWTIKSWEQHLQGKLNLTDENRIKTNIRMLPNTYKAMEGNGVSVNHQS
jgi:hypothetical protein